MSFVSPRVKTTFFGVGLPLWAVAGTTTISPRINMAVTAEARRFTVDIMSLPFDRSTDSLSRYLLARHQGRLLDAERAGVGVERGRDPEWQRRQVLAVAQRQLIQDRYPQRLQALLQDILDRL